MLLRPALVLEEPAFIEPPAVFVPADAEPPGVAPARAVEPAFVLDEPPLFGAPPGLLAPAVPDPAFEGAAPEPVPAMDKPPPTETDLSPASEPAASAAISPETHEVVRTRLTGTTATTV